MMFFNSLFASFIPFYWLKFWYRFNQGGLKRHVRNEYFLSSSFSGTGWKWHSVGCLGNWTCCQQKILRFSRGVRKDFKKLFNAELQCHGDLRLLVSERCWGAELWKIYRSNDLLILDEDSLYWWLPGPLRRHVQLERIEYRILTREDEHSTIIHLFRVKLTSILGIHTSNWEARHRPRAMCNHYPQISRRT